ncbi:metal-dependent transcriptional regulator [Actinotalea sp. AC32]|nr:metal-dependent transcriptional regulator [Actinotalea sp. AC32]
MSARTPSATVEDYLKAVWSLQEWDDAPVTTTRLARRLGVGAPTVSETVQRLAERGWLVHEPYRGVTLTATGRTLAVRMVRRHRVLETWLVDALGYAWDEVHEEAEVLEHAVSDRLVDRLHRALGSPTRDPHGDPVPDADGTVHRPDAVLLADLAAGQAGRVVRVDDAVPEVLRECDAAGVALDVVVVAPVALSGPALRAVRVQPVDAPDGDGGA